MSRLTHTDTMTGIQAYCLRNANLPEPERSDVLAWEIVTDSGYSCIEHTSEAAGIAFMESWLLAVRQQGY